MTRALARTLTRAAIHWGALPACALALGLTTAGCVSPAPRAGLGLLGSNYVTLGEEWPRPTPTTPAPTRRPVPLPEPEVADHEVVLTVTPWVVRRPVADCAPRYGAYPPSRRRTWTRHRRAYRPGPGRAYRRGYRGGQPCPPAPPQAQPHRWRGRWR